MTKSVIFEYKRLRKTGIGAKECLESAKIRSEWDRLESMGLVKLEAIPDDYLDLSYLEQDCFKDRAGQKLVKDIYRKAEREGGWGIVGMYRTSEHSEWITGDSVFGFIGDDWIDSGYDIDIMRQTIQCLNNDVEVPII